MLTGLAWVLAGSAAFLAWRKPVFGVALAVFMIPFDWPVNLGALTVYSNEWLLLGLGAGWAARIFLGRAWGRTVWSDFFWAAPFLAAALLSGLNALHWAPVFKQALRYAQMAFLAAYAAQACVREKDVLENLRLIMGLGLAVSLAGIVQSLAGPSAGFNAGREAFTLYDGKVMRAYGTLGHPNQLAAYLVLILPAAVVEAFLRRTWRERALPATAAAVMGLALLLTFSRGAWVGLALAGLLLFVFLVPRAWLWRGLAGLLVFLVLGYAGMKLFPGPGSLVADRMHSMQHPEKEDSVNFRRVCLETAGKMFRTHPWLGFGAGEYTLNIRKHFDEKYYAWSAIDKHIHNLYAQIAIETGLLGLAGFFLWLGYWLWIPWTRLQTLAPGASRSLLAACLAGVVAFFIHNHFDVLTVYARGTHAAMLMGLAMALARVEPVSVKDT
jgi:O-antigen ligase